MFHCNIRVASAYNAQYWNNSWIVTRGDKDDASNINYHNTSDHQIVQSWTVQTNHPTCTCTWNGLAIRA